MRAQPDGHTLLVETSNAINATLYDKLNYNLIRDIAAVAGFIRVQMVMVVNPSVPAKTLPEFIAYAKANPGKINMGRPGNGTPQHVAGELFKMMTGVDNDPRAISRWAPGAQRPDQWPSADDVQVPCSRYWST